MKFKPLLLLLCFAAACSPKPGPEKTDVLPMEGTWKLISGTLIEKGDTVVTRYDKDQSFIKVINKTHFAFLLHDLKSGKDTSKALFSAGGGTYTLKDTIYTEHLEYCSDRAWEGHNFPFTISFKGDTLIQMGVEKIEAQGIDRLNIEKYVRFNPEHAH